MRVRSLSIKEKGVFVVVIGDIFYVSETARTPLLIEATVFTNINGAKRIAELTKGIAVMI